ncbi:hypothetical protein [Streptomyces sp. NPDC021622]|uniref:hypothetical protein n=1 Tax=Streptomyces sp. NPDC021622 TaxID=3155013 RepID=UPI0033CD443E
MADQPAAFGGADADAGVAVVAAVGDGPRLEGRAAPRPTTRSSGSGGSSPPSAIPGSAAAYCRRRRTPSARTRGGCCPSPTARGCGAICAPQSAWPRPWFR